VTFALPTLLFEGAAGSSPEDSTSRRYFRVHGTNTTAPLSDASSGVDESAFLLLWNSHAARLADVAYRYVRSSDAAADIVQQVFIAIWESRETLDVHTSLANFLYGAVRNRATNVLAHDRVVRAHRERIASEYDATRFAAYNDAELAIDAEEFVTMVRSLVDALPPKTREIFLMSREDGLAPAEIASVLGLSPQTVYNQLARAVRSLSEGLANSSK
jgi:RNA polymerase sigma-70 factor (family 1)